MFRLGDHVNRWFPQHDYVSFDVTNVVEWLESHQNGAEFPSSFKRWHMNLPYPFTFIETSNDQGPMGICCHQQRPGADITLFPISERSMAAEVASVPFGGRLEAKEGRFLEAHLRGDASARETFHVCSGLVLWTISFCNASKKITEWEPIQDIKPPAKVVRAQRKRGKTPFRSYKVLCLPGLPKPQIRHNADIPDPSSFPEHWVRSHPMVGTTERPLFGQAWGVGVFYVPAHKRGDRKNGVAHKDYRVTAGVDG